MKIFGSVLVVVLGMHSELRGYGGPDDWKPDEWKPDEWKPNEWKPDERKIKVVRQKRQTHVDSEDILAELETQMAAIQSTLKDEPVEAASVRRKLNLAAKGVVTRLKRQNPGRSPWFGLACGLENAQARARDVINQDESWRKLLKKLLNDEHQETFRKTERSNRAEFLVTRGLRRLEPGLAFSDSQRERLAQIVLRDDATTGAVRDPWHVLQSRIERRLRTLSRTEFSELSASQWMAWKNKFKEPSVKLEPDQLAARWLVAKRGAQYRGPGDVLPPAVDRK